MGRVEGGKEEVRKNYATMNIIWAYVPVLFTHLHSCSCPPLSLSLSLSLPCQHSLVTRALGYFILLSSEMHREAWTPVMLLCFTRMIQLKEEQVRQERRGGGKGRGRGKSKLMRGRGRGRGKAQHIP